MEWIEKSCNKRTRAKSTGWQSLNLIHPYIWKRSKPQWTSEHSEVAQLCPTLCDPMNYSLPGSSIHGIFQARVLEWIAISFSITNLCSSQFSCSVMSDSLRPHESQHTKSPCPSPTPRVHSNSCPLSWWCHPTISSSVTSLPSIFGHKF